MRGTQNVLSSACEAGVGGFVFASSGTVYGVLRLMPASEEEYSRTNKSVWEKQTPW